MDRLTRRSEVSGIMLVRGHGLGPAYFDSKRDYKIYCEAIDRLAAYEDTGLEPEEIAEYIDATDEYVRASEDGRLIVLPCKVGDTVWQVHPSYYGARQVTYHSVSGIVEDLEKGWGIGDTIEEAEAALGGGGDG